MSEITLQGIRQQYPQYGDLSDERLAQALHQKYYNDMPFETFAGRIGYTPITASPKDYDPAPLGGKIPQGFYAVTGEDGKQTLRHESGLSDVVHALSDLPGVGMAERIGQGATRLAGKAASGIAGIFGGPGAVQKVQGAVNQATELPPSNDPLVQGTGLIQQGAEAVGAPIDRAVSSLSPGPRTAIEATEEALPDIAGLLGARGLAPEAPATTQIARSPTEVGKVAGYTGLRTKADLTAVGNQAITDALISKDAGIVPGQTPSIAALENARRVGPGRGYTRAEAAIPPQLVQDPELVADLGNLPHQVSQLPRSPDVDALQETMLSQPNFTRDELFANIREARERAKSHWKSDDPDKSALGDAYHSLANAYEEFAGRQLDANPDAGVSLADWQADRVQMAKNYQAQGALRGEHFNAQVYGRTAERNPHLLTGNAAIVGHVANGLPSSGLVGMADIGPTAGGALAGEALGQHMGIPGVGALSGAVAAPMIRAKLQQLITRGKPYLAAQTATNPALSYFFNQGRMPKGWNRSPVIPQIAGLLPSPSMVNAGGGATTPNTLESLGLTPDVQAAGMAHPAAARLRELRDQLTSLPERPAETLDFQGPQKWGDFSLAPQEPTVPIAQPESIPFENVLEQGGTERPPIGGPKTGYRPPSKSPKNAQVRTPPGEPTLTDTLPSGPSEAQLTFRNKLARDRLQKVAGDLRLEGPGGATGDAIARLRAALERRDRGYAGGGSVLAKLGKLLRSTAEEVVQAPHRVEPMEQQLGKVYTPTGRAVPRDDEYERLQSLVTNQPMDEGHYQWAVVKPSGQVHGAPFDFKGSALRIANSLNEKLPGHTVQALSVESPEIGRFVPHAPDPNSNPFKKATAEDIDQMLSGQQPQMAEGGEVNDNSLARISTFLKKYGGPHAQRLGVGIAKQFYGLDEHGSPTLGGDAWLSSQHGTPPALLDQLTALPAGVIPIANAMAGQGPPGTGGDIPTPQWSTDAAGRLAQLEKQVQGTTGVGEAHTLPEHLEDAAAMLATPLPAAKVAKEAPTLQRLLEMLTPVRPPSLSRYAGDSAMLGGASAGLDSLVRRVAGHAPPKGVDPEFQRTAMDTPNQGYAKGGSVQVEHKIDWSGPLYLPPRGNKETFAQCGTCIHFLKKTGQCYLLRPEDPITVQMSCSFYAQGTPAMEGKPTGRYTPKLAGLVDREVRCENCRFFDTKTEPREHCDLFTQLNRAFPKIFELDRYVDAYGCCNMQTPGERSPEIFKPTGPIGEQKEPT